MFDNSVEPGPIWTILGLKWGLSNAPNSMVGPPGSNIELLAWFGDQENSFLVILKVRFQLFTAQEDRPQEHSGLQC